MRGGMLTEPGKASASIAKSNKHQAGACLYQEKKIGEADDNISVSDFCFIRISSRFHEEKESGSEIAPVAGQHIKRKDQLGQRRKDPEVSGRTDQGKTGTHIV